MQLKIKTANDSAPTLIMAEPKMTVLELKEIIASTLDIESSLQRLIFSGKVLKDEQTLESYKMADGNTIHLVKGAKPKPTTQETAAPTPTPTSSATQPRAAAPVNPFAALLNPAMMPGIAAPASTSPLPLGSPGMAGMAPMMAQLLSNPAMLQQLMAMDPRLASIMTPEMQNMMNSPGFQQILSDPNMIQSMMGMMGGGMPGGGVPGVLPGGANPLFNPFAQANQGTPGANTNVNPLAGLMNNPMLSAAMAGGFGQAAVRAPVANPEVTYQTQLRQLQDMGFYSAAENITALNNTGGNVDAAVEWLLSHPPGST